MSDPGPSFNCLCVTFRFIVSNWTRHSKQFRGISASQDSIRVWGADNGGLPIQIPYPEGSWVTVFVEWSNKGKRVGSVNINNKQSVTKFNCQILDDLQTANIWIGAKENGEQSMHGALAALEIYGGERIIEESKLPKELKNLIIRDQMVKI